MVLLDLAASKNLLLEESIIRGELFPEATKYRARCTELACQSLLTVLINFGFLVFGVTMRAS
jgi:hypothetical protein